MSDECFKQMNNLRMFMFDNVYNNAATEQLQLKADRMLAMLFDYYVKHPDKVPANMRIADDVTTFVCDYIASMSDIFAISTAKSLFIPEIEM